MQRTSKAIIAACAVAATAATGVGLSGAFSGASASSGAAAGDASELPDVCEERPRRSTPIDTAKLIIEFNSTDDDIGVHGAFDDHGWSALCVFAPNGRPIAVFDPKNQLDDLTMAGVFFESREPPGNEFSFADLKAAFPEGQYKVRAKNFDGKVLTGAATFTHDVPAPPVITAPALAEDPEQPGAPVPKKGLVVRWDPVTETVDGGPVDITGYEVIVTKEDHDDPHGFSKPIYDVHVGPNARSLSVPASFLEHDEVYELEVLALEESGNQTITVGFFLVA
jgi:hypothetical protein